MLQIVMTKRIGSNIIAVSRGEAGEGNQAMVWKFAKVHRWMVHILSPSDRGEILRPAIAYHVWVEKGQAREKYDEFLASQS
jgi:hypothetical protein